MIGLTKVNKNWIPLQAKVFSRWVSNQLKNVEEVEVQDVCKDLSNGVALVELAKVLTHEEIPRLWTRTPRRKVDMVENCNLSLEMFKKDGVNFVGISGKDISDNNEKLILGLIWTLILHYSVNKSISTTYNTNNKNEIINNKENQNDKKEIKETFNSKKELMKWAISRTENYPNVHNFKPYDLSLCALLDSYFPQKVNYYSLNPEDSEHNNLIATKVMEEVGIPVYVYADELTKTHNEVDDKTLLTQLSSAKEVLDKSQTKKFYAEEKEESSEYSDEEEPETNENYVGESIEMEQKIERQQQEINQLTKDYEDARNDVKLEIEARIIIENKLADLTESYYKLKNNFIKERKQKNAIENQLKQEREANIKLNEDKELILTSFANLETERDEEKYAKSQAESEVNSLKLSNKQLESKIKELTSQLESSKNDVKILSKALKEQKIDNDSSSNELQNEITSLTASLEEAEEYLDQEHDKKEELKTNLFELNHELERLRKHYRYEKMMNQEYREELQHLSLAYDSLMIEKNIEADYHYELEDLLNNQSKIDEREQRLIETVQTYSHVIQNTLSKINKLKEEKNEVEFKNMCLSNALMKSIKELTDARRAELYTKELEAEVERLTTELENVEDYIESQNESKEQLQQDFQQLESEFIHLANDFEYERRAKREYRSEVKRLGYAFDAAQIEKDVEIEEREDAEFQVCELKNALEETEAKLEETQKRSNETIKTYSKVIQNTLYKLHLEKEARKEAEFNNIRLSGALVEAVNDLVDAKGTQNDIRALEIEIERLSKELENLETYCEVQCEKKEIAETEVQILQSKMEGLEQEKFEADNEVERLTYALELNQSFDDNNSDALEKTKEEINELNSEVASAKFSVNKLEKAYERAQRKINILKHALSDSQKKNFEEANELNYAEQKEKELKEHVEDLESIVDAQENDIIIDKQEEINNSDLIREENVYTTIDEDDNTFSRNDKEVDLNNFVGQPMESNNFRLAGQKFGLTMTIDGKTYALTLANPNEQFINPAGLKLDLAQANIENDVNQQFVFGKDAWNTVIDSVAKQGMVWDVANSESWNPPNGTEFYLYPFHGRHNQHFIYKDNMIYAKQNGQVVTYVGNDFPFVMSEPTEALKENQTFNIQLL